MYIKTKAYALNKKLIFMTSKNKYMYSIDVSMYVHIFDGVKGYERFY